MQYYPRRAPYVKRTISATLAAAHPVPELTQAEQIAARLAQLRADTHETKVN